MGGHPGYGQATAGSGANCAVIAGMPVRIGHDRLPPDLVKGDVLGRVAGSRCKHDGGEHALGVSRRPLQGLHAAHRAADDGEQLINTQMIEQPGLRTHHVGDGDHRESGAVGRACRGVRVSRAGAAHTAPQNIRADDEVAVGIEGFSRPDQRVPPARLAGDGMIIGDVLIAGQGMADQDRIAARRVQMAMRRIGDPDRGQIDTAIEPEWLIGGKIIG